MIEGDTTGELHTPTVGMTQAPLLTKLHSPIINMNRSMETSSSGKEGDTTLPDDQAPATVEAYLQAYHPDYIAQPKDPTVSSIEATSTDIHSDPISPQQHAQFQL